MRTLARVDRNDQLAMVMLAVAMLVIGARDGGQDIRQPLPPPDLYVSTALTPGMLYEQPNFPTQVQVFRHDSITALAWAEMGPQSATATGALSVDNCEPDCVSGVRVHYPVRLVASNPRRCEVTIYQNSTDTPTKVPAYVFSTITVRASSGSPSLLSGPPLFAPACA